MPPVAVGRLPALRLAVAVSSATSADAEADAVVSQLIPSIGFFEFSCEHSK
jgi:hypothetical protein